MLPYVMAWLSKFEREEEGQGLVEYALILVLVSIACIVALTALGGAIGPVFDRVTTALAL